MTSAPSRRRLIIAGSAAVAIAALVAIGLHSLSSDHGGAATQARSQTTEPSSPGPPARLSARIERQRLPAPVSGEAVVADGRRLLVIGGLDAGQASSSDVLSFDPKAARVAPAGSLAEPLHDEAAAIGPGGVLVLGGGAASSTDSVEVLPPGGTGQVVGTLPAPRSDLAAVAVGQRVYVLGGYDGATPAKPVLATRDGRRFAVVGDLALPVRYPAVAVARGSIFTFGGETGAGTATSAIQRVDIGSGRSQVVGHLPGPTDHATAMALSGGIYILGGQVNGSPSNRILRFDPASGAVRSAGKLPQPLSDAAGAAIGDSGYLVGGVGDSGQPVDTVVRVIPATAGRGGS